MSSVAVRRRLLCPSSPLSVPPPCPPPLPVYIGSVSPSGRSVGGCPLALPFRREVYRMWRDSPLGRGIGRRRNGRKNNFRRGLRPQTVRVLSASPFLRVGGGGEGASLPLCYGREERFRNGRTLFFLLPSPFWGGPPANGIFFPHSKWRCAYFQEKSRK